MAYVFFEALKHRGLHWSRQGFRRLVLVIHCSPPIENNNKLVHAMGSVRVLLFIFSAILFHSSFAVADYWDPVANSVPLQGEPSNTTPDNVCYTLVCIEVTYLPQFGLGFTQVDVVLKNNGQAYWVSYDFIAQGNSIVGGGTQASGTLNENETVNVASFKVLGTDVANLTDLTFAYSLEEAAGKLDGDQDELSIYFLPFPDGVQTSVSLGYQQGSSPGPNDNSGHSGESGQYAYDFSSATSTITGDDVHAIRDGLIIASDTSGSVHVIRIAHGGPAAVNRDGTIAEYINVSLDSGLAVGSSVARGALLGQVTFQNSALGAYVHTRVYAPRYDAAKSDREKSIDTVFRIADVAPPSVIPDGEKHKYDLQKKGYALPLESGVSYVVSHTAPDSAVVDGLDFDDDGVANSLDPCPEVKEGTIDTDSDGICNFEDLDDDGDGVLDVSDQFPLDASKSELIAVQEGGGGAVSIFMLTALFCLSLFLWPVRRIKR